MNVLEEGQQKKQRIIFGMFQSKANIQLSEDQLTRLLQMIGHYEDTVDRIKNRDIREIIQNAGDNIFWKRR